MNESRQSRGVQRVIFNASMNGIGQVVPMILGVFVVPFLLRGFGVERFGLLTLGWTLIGVFALFDFGLGRAITQSTSSALASGGPEEVEEIFNTGLISILVLGIIGGVLLTILANPIASSLKVNNLTYEEVIWSVRVVAVGLPAVTLMSGIKGFLESMGEFKFINTHRIIIGLGNFLVPLALLRWSSHVAIHISSLVIIRYLSLFFQFNYARKLCPSSQEKKPYQWSRFMTLLRFGGWMTTSNLVSPLMVYIDRFFIGSIIGLASVTIYATLVDTLTRVLVVPNSVVSAIFPIMAETTSDKTKNLHGLFRKSLFIIGLLVIPPALIAFVFAPQILTLWLGADFSMKGQAIFRVLLVGIAINALSAMPYALLQASGRPDLNAKIHIIELPIYLLAAYFFSTWWGLIGVAVAWSFRIFLDAIVLFVVGDRIMRGQPCPSIHHS